MDFQTYILKQITAEKAGVQRKTALLKGKDGDAFLAGYKNALESLERKVKQYDRRNHTQQQQSFLEGASDEYSRRAY